MRQIVMSSIALAVLGAAVAGLIVVIGVDRTDLVLDAYLVFFGGLVALAAARVAGHAFPAPRRIVSAVLGPSRSAYGPPESLAVAEDEVALAQADQFNLHYRLRPVLTEIAEAGLAAEHGIDLEREPERSRMLLSPLAWDLVRADRPRPENADTRGISTADLSALVDELETILRP